MGRANSLEKTLMLGKTEGNRRREQQRMRWLDKQQVQVEARALDHLALGFADDQPGGVESQE